MNRKALWLGVGILVLAGIALVIIPMISHHVTPAWTEDGGKFLHDVGEAMQEYSLAHEGKTPSSLSLLYPEYMRDERVTRQVSLFAKQRMAIIYWNPMRMQDSDRPVAQLILDPSVTTDYPWRSIVLWGDGHVKLHKGQ